MSLTDRDRKIVMFVVPLVVILAYWFLLLSPKREEAATAGAEQTAQEQRRDLAQQHVDQLSSAKTDFAADYAEIVRLGKAVPESVDMPTLLVQLQAAADGTGVKFTSISAEDRESAGTTTTTPAPQAPAAPGSGDGSQPAAAGGAPAQSGPGTAAETAGNTVTGANNASQSAEQSGINPADTATSAPVRDGGLPIGGGSATPDGTTATGTSGVAGLDAVPLTLQFDGNFFGLANFFHRLKRYVETSHGKLLVRGRLLTIDGISFTSDPTFFPELTAEITATAYLAPASEGTTAGATPSGPAVTPASATPAPAAPLPTTPTATATR